jgi:hypothetical protein
VALLVLLGDLPEGFELGEALARADASNGVTACGLPSPAISRLTPSFHQFPDHGREDEGERLLPPGQTIVLARDTKLSLSIVRRYGKSTRRGSRKRITSMLSSCSGCAAR